MDLRKKLTSLVAQAFLLAAAPLLIGANGLTSNLSDRILAAHNRERATLGVAPMAWDTGLQASAQAWADQLAATNAFEHSSQDSDDPEGENLWAGTKGAYSIDSMVYGWTSEKKLFRQGVFPDNSVTGDVGDVGHYTQILWRRTGSVGCAMATGRHDDVLVCRYSTAGNYEGERVF